MLQHRPPLARRESILLARKDSSASGVMLFAKESGPTSFSSLGVIKKALGTGKVGHTGTLDSFAEGLLVVLVGKMTRLVPYITATEKRYQAVVAFGSETDTLEPSGQVVAAAPLPSRQQVESVLDRFRGTISQVPPLYSAIHVDGQRASDLARSGQQAQLPSREITVHSLALTDFDGQYGLLEVTCSKGTYIRSLARDIALAAGSRGHLVALRRTGVGPFRLEDAVFSQRLTAFTLASRGQGEVPAAKASQAPLLSVNAIFKTSKIIRAAKLFEGLDKKVPKAAKKENKQKSAKKLGLAIVENILSRKKSVHLKTSIPGRRYLSKI